MLWLKSLFPNTFISDYSFTTASFTPNSYTGVKRDIGHDVLVRLEVPRSCLLTGDWGSETGVSFSKL